MFITKPTAAYIHIPFCAHHCGYCDFAVAVGASERIDEYLIALEREISGVGTPVEVRTRFLGGGTPTFLSPTQLRTMFRMLDRRLPLADGGEFSIESTPETLDDERLDVLSDFGVNRVSIGVQSFREDHLRTLDRIHSAEGLASIVERVRRRIPNVSLDLIFGIPGQTPGDWANDLDAALRLQVPHLSTYGLTYEKGTPLWKARAAGRIIGLDEETEAAMYEYARDVLEGAGYEHYEISNFARPGYRCRHNEVYWANESYFGFGVGAARYIDGKRELNCRNLRDYLARIAAGRSPTFQREELEPRERALETIALQLRRADGIDRVAFAAQTGFQVEELVGSQLREQVRLGLLTDDGVRLALSRRGRSLADAVIEKLFR